MGAPIGNQNARKRHFTTAVEAAVFETDPVTKRRKLDYIAQRLVQLAQDGDMAAIREVGDRLDGKPKQQQEITGADGGALAITFQKDDSIAL